MIPIISYCRRHHNDIGVNCQHLRCCILCISVSRPYEIMLNDSNSTIKMYDSPMQDDFIRLAHMPLQSPGPIYKLSDIVSNINNLHSDIVSFTAAVRAVSIVFMAFKVSLLLLYTVHTQIIKFLSNIFCQGGSS